MSTVHNSSYETHNTKRSTISRYYNYQDFNLRSGSKIHSRFKNQHEKTLARPRKKHMIKESTHPSLPRKMQVIDSPKRERYTGTKPKSQEKVAWNCNCGSITVHRPQNCPRTCFELANMQEIEANPTHRAALSQEANSRQDQTKQREEDEQGKEETAILLECVALVSLRLRTRGGEERWIGIMGLGSERWKNKGARRVTRGVRGRSWCKRWRTTGRVKA